MTTNQPQWKLIANLGDHGDQLNSGAVLVYIDETGVYAPECEVWEPDEERWDSESDASPGRVYRFILEPCTYIDGILSDNRFFPKHPAWFSDDLERLAKSCDQTVSEIAALFTSADARERAWAWREIGEYHGYFELDDYPLELNSQEAEARYGRGSEIYKELRQLEHAD